MKFNRSLMEKLLIVFAILTPVTFAIRLYIYWKELDLYTGFFKDTGSGYLIYNVIVLLVFVICLALSFSKKGKSIEKKKRKRSAPSSVEEDILIRTKEVVAPEEEKMATSGFDKTVSIWSGTLSAFATFFMALAFLSYGISLLFDEEMRFDPFNLSLSALSLLSCLFFFVYAFRHKPGKSNTMAFFALAPSIWCALRLLTEYRDITRFINRDLYVGQFLFLVSTLIFFVYQAQMLVNDKVLSRPNSYAFNLIPVIFLGLVARLPQLVAILGDKAILTIPDATCLLIDLAITLFAAVKLSAVMKNA